MSKSRRERNLRKTLLGAIAATAVGLSATGGGVASAATCTFEPTPSPFFKVTATKTTCSKAQTLGKAWAKRKSCHSTTAKAKATCTVKEFKCTSRIANPEGAAYEEVTCRKGTAVVKFNYGFG